MLRTLVITLAFGAAGAASAEQFPQSVLHADVIGPEGTVVGRVSAVERNADGEVVAVEIPGLEPPDAASPARPLVAERERARAILVAETRDARREQGGATQTHLR